VPAAPSPRTDRLRLLITGGAGFIGSHLAEAWLAAGGAVRVLDDLSTGRLANLEACRGHSGFEFRQGSVLDRAELCAALQGVDLVAHLASLVGVERVLAEPARTVAVGAGSGRRLASLCRERRLPLLCVSSSEVYGPWALPPLREPECERQSPADLRAWGPRGRYARAKRVAERAALGPGGPSRAAVVRLFNVSGPRQGLDSGMLLPRLVSAALTGAPLELFGDGLQTRSFCHVLDAAEGLLRLARGLCSQDGWPHRLYNLGSDRERSLLEVAGRVRALLAPAAEIRVLGGRGAPGRSGLDPRRRAPCLKRLEADLGWRPTRGLDPLILDLAGWFRTSLESPRSAAISGPPQTQALGPA
jgi:UDP-glucose 4-epimerase